VPATDTQPIFICEWCEVRSYREREEIAKRAGRFGKKMPPTIGRRSWAIYTTMEKANARRALLLAERGSDAILVTIRREVPPGSTDEQPLLDPTWPLQHRTID
jgi:hypothetical protein